MSWILVAKKDFQDASRSRLLWGLTAVYVLLLGGVAYGYTVGSNVVVTPDPGTIGFLTFLQGIVSFFVSIIAVVVAYRAIAGERESGTIDFLLGLPHSRLAVVLGKVAGRAGVVSLAMFVGFAGASVVLIIYGGSFDTRPFLLFALLSVFYAVTFVSVTVALSAVTARAARAAAAGIGFWVLIEFWGVGVVVVVFVAQGFSRPERPHPDWSQVLAGLGPDAAFSAAVRYVIPSTVPGQGQPTTGPLPEWYGLIVLAGWLVLPLALGILRFQRCDLSATV